MPLQLIANEQAATQPRNVLLLPICCE